MTNEPDTLAIARQLETDYGLEPHHAAATVMAVQALTAHLATRADLAELGTELRGGMAELRGELRGGMGELRTELRGEMAKLRTELRGEMAELRGELRGEMGELRGGMGELRGGMGELRGEIHKTAKQQLMWVGAGFLMVLATQVGVLAAVIG